VPLGLRLGVIVVPLTTGIAAELLLLTDLSGCEKAFFESGPAWARTRDLFLIREVRDQRSKGISGTF
jgi:hypothetical protein